MNKSKKARYTQYQLEMKLIEIRDYQNKGMTTKQISEITGIPIRTLTYYNKKISEKYKEIWDDITKESLEGRVLLIKEKYEKLARKAEEKLNDPKASTKDIDTAGKLLIACHLNIYNMLKNGPLKINSIPAKEIEENHG
jgi:hypothetical protein